MKDFGNIFPTFSLNDIASASGSDSDPESFPRPFRS